MTIEGILFVIIQLMLLLNWPVAIILMRAANHKPRIRALTVMAVATTLIAIGLTVYVWAVINAATGYVIPKEAAAIFFRLVLIGLGVFPIWFLWLYVTHRFADGSPADDHAYNSGAQWGEPTKGPRVQIDQTTMTTGAPIDEADADTA